MIEFTFHGFEAARQELSARAPTSVLVGHIEENHPRRSVSGPGVGVSGFGTRALMPMSQHASRPGRQGAALIGNDIDLRKAERLAPACASAE